MGPILGAERSTALIGRVLELEALADARDLRPLLSS
jgi:hypothetical protein